MKTPVLYIVIPCYNEEEALPITAKRMAELLDDLTEKRPHRRKQPRDAGGRRQPRQDMGGHLRPQ